MRHKRCSIVTQIKKERFSMLTSTIQKEIHSWHLQESEPDLASELEELIQQSNENALNDAFYKTLSFGTAGIRGIMGVGTNRMNVHTVAQAMQGIANWINLQKRNDKKNPSLSAPCVALCRDSRINSEKFERVCAEVFAANGIQVKLYPRIEPVPTLSFAVQALGCAAGIMVTSSHNPRQYNGCKVFAHDGCQIAGKVAGEISEAISQVDLFNGPKRAPFQEALADGHISFISDEILDKFLKEVFSLSEPTAIIPGHSPRVVYTPLNGTGLELMQRSFKHIGLADVLVVPEQAKPDGNFPTCPYPNPEFREALDLGLKLCNKTYADILIATDPDADRMGVAVRHEGEYRLLSGNEMGVLLTNWLVQRCKRNGEDLKKKVAVSTIVSTDMLDPIAMNYGFQLRRTLTGFKNIGGQIATLHDHGGIKRWLIGFEESYGYLLGPYVKDKDAITSSTVFVEMASWYYQKKINLVEVMDQLYHQYGYYLNRTLNFQFPGSEGAQKMETLMMHLRKKSSISIAGSPVVKKIDYESGVSMPMTGGLKDPPQSLPFSNVLEWRLEDKRKVLIRPSGTEPKIKCYLFARGKTREESLAGLDSLEKAVRKALDAK